MIILDPLSVRPSNFGDFLLFNDSYIWWKDFKGIHKVWVTFLTFHFFWWLHVDLIRCKHANSWKWKNSIDLPTAVYFIYFVFLQETYGEDPYLTGVYATGYVQGLQGPNPHYVRATSGCKHFAAYAGPENRPVSRLGFNAQVKLIVNESTPENWLAFDFNLIMFENQYFFSEKIFIVLWILHFEQNWNYLKSII